ncbi:hypothetical protein C8R44DRAFT_838188 [Mycena epipterygia]|nr:hypothetical protein C8R44DRAFT_838188 [Mycena epipterygia]
MASHYQAHSGPGPSTYYMQPQSPAPPQNYVYGPPSPGSGPAAGPNGYPYQYPGPPPAMASHHPGMPPQGASPRMNSRGVNGTGYIPQSPRGGHTAYQPQPHPNYRPPYAAAQYSQHPQMPPKYPQQAYQHQPPYVYGPPPPASAWVPPQQHQPLSQLPKDGNTPMSPPQTLSPALAPPYYGGPPPLQDQNHSQHQHEPQQHPPQDPAQPPAESAETDAESEPAPLAQASSYAQIGTISASSSASSPKPPSSPKLPTSPTSPTSLLPTPSSPGSAGGGAGGWAIWSRRPLDPARAPGIIISPHARPPPDIVAHALDERTPPPSPVIEAAVTVDSVHPLEIEPEVEKVADVETEIQPEVEIGTETEPETETETPSSGVSTTDAGVRTPTTVATTVPGSPVSGTSPSAVKVPLPVAPADSADSSASASASASTSTATTATSDPTLPATSAAPPPKKSWASLLRPTTTNGASPAGTPAAPRKNGLPTSSVVGFSIPAPTPAQIADRVDRAGLLALLMGTGAAGASGGAVDVPSGAAEGTRLTPRGLINTGNMCFANAVLQALVYCAPFSALFARLHALIGDVDKDGGEGSVLEAAPMVRATGAFLREFVVGPKEGSSKEKSVGANGKGKARAETREEEDDEREAFIPTGVYDALKGKKQFDHMRGGHQEDAEEFLGFYLDTLEEELLAVVAALAPSAARATTTTEEREEAVEGGGGDGWLEVGRKNRTVVTRTIKGAESPITRIFGGKFRTTLRAPGQKDSVIVEDWRALRLDIQRDQIHTIEDALAFISHPQTVQLSHAAAASQQVLIEALPPVLVLHVKRFCYDTAVGGVVKVGKPIAFGPELEVGGDVMAPTARRGGRYKLFGVVYHHGVSAGGGHYTLDVRHPVRGWVRIDDELVSDVRPDDVFGAAGRDEARCAYLLFYKRVGAGLG